MDLFPVLAWVVYFRFRLLRFPRFCCPWFGGSGYCCLSKLNKLGSFEGRILVDGSCLLVSMCSNSLGLYKRVHIINLRNFWLSGGQVSNIGQELDDLFQDNAARPKEEFGIILGGFNFFSGDDRVFKVGLPSSGASTTPTTSSSGSHRTAWMKYRSRWTELVQPFPTHFDPKGNGLSRLDWALFRVRVVSFLSLIFSVL